MIIWHIFHVTALINHSRAFQGKVADLTIGVSAYDK